MPRRSSGLGIVDDEFTNQRAPTRSHTRNAANNEVTLSASRNKALARLGAAEDGMSAFQQPLNARKKRRKPLLPLKFHDPDVESEYRLTAYLMHRSFLIWLLLLFCFTYIVVGVVTLLHDSQTDSVLPVDDATKLAAFALRLAAAALAFFVAVMVTCCQPSLFKAQLFTGLAFLLLWVAALAAEVLRGGAREVPELILVTFAAYAVLCPSFHIRLVATGAVGLLGLQALSLVLVMAYSGAQQGLLLAMLLRELLKGLVMNAIGIWLARRSERSHRETFVNAKLFQEELMLRKAVCSDVQRLLLNTLPEPIVREIAAGQPKIAHRYGNVTVLQADMVGFTPLSAAKGPEEVLGILSELFEAFDQAAERWGVHKVKTIGDAYIVCCGAFVLADEDAKAATRVVNMALTMQYIVSTKAFERGVDISVRIGVHTGMVIGGVIGTVRFHWDMWGNGVAGAVRLEELGARGRVHISDVTAELVKGKFPMEPNITSDDEVAASLEEGFGIAGSFLIQETEMNMASYAPKNDVALVSTEYDFSEILQTDDGPQLKLAIDDIVKEASGGTGKGRGMSMLRRVREMLSMPSISGSVGGAGRSMTRSMTRGRGGSDAKGTGQVTNAIAFMKSLTAADEDEEGASMRVTKGLGGASGGARPQRKNTVFGTDTAKLWDGASAPVPGINGGASGASTKSLERLTTGSHSNWRTNEDSGERGTKMQSLNMDRNFFVKKADARHSSTFNEKLKLKNAEEERERLQEAQRFLTRESEVIIVVSVIFGLYDFLQGYDGAIASGGAGNMLTLLLVRYTALVPLLLLTRQLLAGPSSVGRDSKGRDDSPMPISQQRVFLFCLCLIAMPTLHLIAASGLSDEEVRLCPDLSSWGVSQGQLPLCGSEGTSLGAASSAPSGVPPYLCALANASDPSSAASASAGYCKYGFAGDYTRTLGMLSIVCSYMLVYARLSTVASASVGSSAIALVFVLIAQPYILWRNDPDRYALAGWKFFEVLSLFAWWTVAHLCGWLHYRVRFINLYMARLLRKRHQRVLASIREETEHCEKLLKNILPPHVLKHLGGLLAHADHAAKGHHLQAKTIAERYHDCSFLFAKIGGLSKLVNDADVSPADMMGVLQIIFDRFDALADMFGVQKVRKTANEYYLVAAGLPDAEILPTAEQRACGIAGFGFAMINIMNIINIELAEYGISFSCQVGIHSGSAIAGIIGHKTFQYDLCGDAVNTAARMCSYSKPGHVNISQTTFELVRHKFGALPRGELNVKGKGKMKTYFLLNMPVEQQEALQQLSTKLLSEKELQTAHTMVDRWARKIKLPKRDTGGAAGKHVHGLASSAAGREGSSLTTPSLGSAAAASQGATQGEAQAPGAAQQSPGGGFEQLTDRMMQNMRNIVGSSK